MTAHLNHTIVYARDKQVSARFLAGILGIAASPSVARFLPVFPDPDGHLMELLTRDLASRDV